MFALIKLITSHTLRLLASKCLFCCCCCCCTKQPIVCARAVVSEWVSLLLLFSHTIIISMEMWLENENSPATSAIILWACFRFAIKRSFQLMLHAALVFGRWKKSKSWNVETWFFGVEASSDLFLAFRYSHFRTDNIKWKMNEWVIYSKC